MKKYSFGLFLVLFTALTPSIIRGDVIDLDNGSKIIGKIEKISDKKITVKTDFAGKLTIEMKNVAHLSSDEPLFVAFENGK